ncbi:glycosyltransferase [Roseococcus sp. SYP-B2431]|uniref:glycosyltransferase n=1 Tax=Roseococcus sp. SYP-B2431 TaxID=2496640 RepID=UPI00103885E2|nr:glycosyltransferase [Roseococcus sp. SYP-B2431]TCH97114.1 glycosyltransferase [Roseococcus sp. SYP-B2431]
MRICLLSLDMLGPIHNGGIGTAFTSLAEALAAAGHDVTLAYPADHTETAPLSHWVRHYAGRGIRLECLYARGEDKRLALAAYHWLKRRDFDAIHFHEWRGIGHFLVKARRQGLAFRDTALICQLHSPSEWHREYSHRFATGHGELERAWLERGSAEGADLVISPSRYMLDWVREAGWRLPERAIVLPNLLPAGFACREPTRGPVGELVFFGRLEERKGLALFCQAIGLMITAGAPPRRVTFLGKVGEMGNESALRYIGRAAQAWNFPWAVRNDLDVLGARDFLAAPGRIAVIASIMENSPYTVLECLAAGIPFLAADCGGVAELVAEEDRGRVLYRRTADDLAALLVRTLRDGAPGARPAFDLGANRENWLALHQAPLAAARPEPAGEPPLVSICMATFNRHGLLAEAIASVEAQTYPRVELVLVDDASTDPAARSFLDSLEPRFAARGWQLLRNPENLYLGATRNRAAAAARGEFLLFMDDDNLARPDEVESFVRAARHSDAEILTSQFYFFAGRGAGPDRIPEMPNHWIPLGGPVPLGFFANPFGDANFLVRRDVFEQLGAFSTDRASFEDWEFLLRAATAGRRIECLPETLYAYRVNEAAMLRSMSLTDAHRSFRRVMRAWADAPPSPDMRAALVHAADMGMHELHKPPPGARLPLNGAEAFCAVSDEALARGDRETARNLMAQACRLEPENRELRLALIGLGGGDPAELDEVGPELLPAARLALRCLRLAGDMAAAEALAARLAHLGVQP